MSRAVRTHRIWCTIAVTALSMVLGSAATGCTADGPIYVDSQFTAEETAAIEAAARSWRDAGATVDLVYGARVTGFDGSRREMIRMTLHGAARYSETFRTAEGQADHNVHGVAARREDIVVAVDAIQADGDSLQAVVTHELGHLLGLEHVGTAETAVMSEYRNSDSPIEPSIIDVAECVRVGGCVRTAGTEEVQVSP